MPKFMKKPYKDDEIRKALNPYVRKWFFSNFKEFSEPQKYGVMEVHNKNNILISAPTGTGKTLTSTLAVINELVNMAMGDILEDKVYCVYINPLKSLSRDIEVNLQKPLDGIKELAKKDGVEIDIRIGARTGDTTQAQKAKMLKKPPHILITTPESLALMISSPNFRENLRDVKYLIIDEAHALAENKRGVHLSLSMERLQDLNQEEITRVGLSATIAPIIEISKYLVGIGRECKIADVHLEKKFNFEIITPVEDLVNTTEKKLHGALYDIMDELIQKHRSTLVFTNTRAGTERIVHHLKQKFPKNYTENIGAHHGSLSKKVRHSIEDKMRKGELKAVVCLTGDTKILLEDGSWKEIKDLYDEKVQTIDDNLKLSSNKIVSRVKLGKSPILKLKSSLGKEIKCSPDHKFFTIDKLGNLVWREAKNLNEGDFIATIRKSNNKSLTSQELSVILFKNYPNYGYLDLDLDFLQSIKEKIINIYGSLKRYWETNVKDISYGSFTHSFLKDQLIRTKIFKKLVYDLGILESKAIAAIKGISSGKKIMPKIILDEKLFRLIGFMMADGYMSDRSLFVSNKNKTLLDYYGKMIDLLSGGRHFIKCSSTGTSILVWDSIFLSKLLQNLGFKKGRKARIQELPDFMFRLSKKYITEFISGYFDGDGYCEVKNKENKVYSAGICTTSKKMAEGLSRLLLQLDIVSSLRSRYYDEIQDHKERNIRKKGYFYDVVTLGGKNLRNFAKVINPKRENILRVKETLTNKGYCNLDVIPNLGVQLRQIRLKKDISSYKMQKQFGLNPVKYELGVRNIGREQLTKLLSSYQHFDDLKNVAQSDLFWEVIKEKKELKEETVYNIEVEKDHNYIANCFFTKNCSTSLELGIDIGYIDLVICIGSPKSVARLLQRAGRAGHKLHDTVKCRIIVMDRDDLIECSVMMKHALEKKIDRIHIPRNCLDVLAQQIHGMAVSDRWNVKEMYGMIKKSYCYENLEHEDFMQIVKYLAGEHTSLEDRHIYAKIWYDEEHQEIGRRGIMSRVLHMTNIGTIPDETSVIVKAGEHVVGTLDESFLERLKRGDIFVLGGDTYEFLFARGMVAQVRAAAEKTPTVPSWFSEMLPLSFDLAMEIQKFKRYVEDYFVNKRNKEDVIKFIKDYLYVDDKVGEAIYNYLREQHLYIGIPNDKKIIIEHYHDDEKKYEVFHTNFGRRVNDVLSRAVGYALGKIHKRDVEIGISDNGFYIASKKNMQAARAFGIVNEKNLREVMERAIEKTEVLKRRFRHCATRSLMILRQYKGKKKRVGKQQVSSMILLSAVRKISEDFAILKEARREVLEDLMDIENAVKIFEWIKDKKIVVKEVTTTIPSPFAFNLVLQGYMDVMKMEDKVEFLKRMHTMVVAKIGKNHKI